MKAARLSAVIAVVIYMTTISLAAKEIGLYLSVQKDVVPAGSPVTLHWEIVPDGISSVAIILGVILPDGQIKCYAGPGKGFVSLETIGTAPRVVTGFPFNTAMTASLNVTIPAAWPKGSYQFVAAVMEGKAIAEIDYSNNFSVE